MSWTKIGKNTQLGLIQYSNFFYLIPSEAINPHLPALIDIQNTYLFWLALLLYDRIYSLTCIFFFTFSDKRLSYAVPHHKRGGESSRSDYHQMQPPAAHSSREHLITKPSWPPQAIPIHQSYRYFSLASFPHFTKILMILLVFYSFH